ncbi:MAG: DUF2807 domain-containing protein [Flavobacteriales bacterium]|nr:DUF2807 domain-containing protein [Flavobacteriales bacterium]
MNRPEEMDKTFEVLRELPVEVTVEQVGRMVAAFTLATPATSWFSNINLNSILMTSAGATIIAGSIYLFGPNDPKRSIAELPVANTISVESAKTEEPAPAVNMDLPSPVVNEEIPAPVLIEEDPAPPVKEEEPIIAFSGPLLPAPAKRSITIVPSSSGGFALQPCTLVMDTAWEPSAKEPIRNETLELPLAAISAGLVPGSTDRVFALDGFTGVLVKGAMNVVLEQGKFSVKAEGDAGLVAGLELTLEDGMLVINSGSNEGIQECGSGKTVTVHVKMPTLERFKLMGSGDVLIEDFTHTGDLDLHLQGSGDIHFAALKGYGTMTIDLDGSGDIHGEGVQVTGKTKVSLSGSGDVRIAGRTDAIEVDLVGSGDVDAGGLETRECDVQVVGSGDVNVNCSGSMRARAMGSGEVYNTGNAGGGGMNDQGSRSN